MKFLLSMVVVVGMLLVVFALSEMAAAADEKVYGYVYDSETEEPIEDADASLYNQDTERGSSTYSDPDGFYELVTTEGNINFVVTKDGYHDSATEFYLNNGEQKKLDVYLERKPEETAKIYGYVYEQSGRGPGDPLQDATIDIYNEDSEEWNRTETDSEGYYEIMTSEGNIEFSVDKDEYYDHYEEFYINDKEEKNVTVHLEKKPEETAKIYGNVYEQTSRGPGDPLQDATVEIYNQDTDEWNETGTDRNGYYELMTAEGTIQYSVHKDDYVKYSDEFYINDKEEKNVTVYLEKKNTKIYGYVYDDDTQEPLEGADVSLYNEDTEDGDWNQTDSEGYYELLTSEGYIYFDVRADGYISHNEQFDIGNDEEKNLDVYLKPKPPENSRIYGYVYEKESRGGDPIPDVSIQVYNQDTSVHNGTSTDENGWYEIRVSGGYIEFSTYHDDYKGYGEEFDIGDDEEKEIIVHLEPKPPENSTIYGYVYEKSGRGKDAPIKDANVYIYNGNTDAWNGTQTDDAGWYEIMTSEGDIEFNVNHDDYKGYNDEFYIGEDEEKEIIVYLEPKPPENSTIHGYVYEKGSGRNGETPLQDVEIGVYNEDVEAGNNTWSDENGYYEMNVAEGTLHIYINDEDGYEDYHESFHVNAEEDVGWDIYLIPQTTLLKGYVFEAEKRRADTPIEDAWVNVRNRDTHSDNGTSTDDAGYYEIWVAEGELEFSINDDDYFSYYDEFYVEANSEYEIDDVYLEVKPEENSIIEGYVYDNDTDVELEDVRVEFYNDEYDYGNDTWTEEEDWGDPGYYMINVYGGTWGVRIEEDGYEDYELELSIDEDDYLFLEIYLVPLPPPDSLIMGYLKDEDENGIEGVVYTNSFSVYGEIDNGTETDTDGYFEVGVYGGGPFFIMTVDNDREFNSFFTFFIIEEEESMLWYNITLYKMRDNNATVKGYVKDEAGNPLEGAQVHLAGTYIGMTMDNDDGGGPGWPLMSKTDDTGYYEFEAPVSAMGRADDETFYLAVEYNDSHGAVKKVVLVEGDNVHDFTLAKPTVGDEINVYLHPKEYDGKEDWNDGYVQFQQPFGLDSSWQTIRLFIDFVMGNRDGEVDEGEKDLFMVFLNYMMENNDGDDGPGNMTDTEGDFYVDNIYYDFEEGFSFGEELKNILGPVDENAIIIQDQDVNLTAHDYIEESTVHTILFNMSYPNDEKDGKENFVIHLPQGFMLYKAEHTDNVSVTVKGQNNEILKMIYVGEVYGDELWEMVEMTVTSEMMGYIERTDDPGNNHTTEGLSASFEAHFVNPEGLTITKTLWDFGEGPCCDNDLKPSYIWNDDGDFEIQFIVEVEQQFVLNTMSFVVDNALPEVEAGANIEDAVAGEELSLAGSFTETGPADTHTILWEAFVGKTVVTTDVVFTDTTSLTPGIMFKRAGTYTLKLTVTDDDGGSGNDTLEVVVTNTDPVAQFDNVEENDIFFGIMDIILSDADGMKDISSAGLMFTKKGEDNWKSISVDVTPGDGFTISWDTTAEADGDYTLRATLEDASGATATAEIDIEINNSLPPKLSVTTDITEDKSVLKWTLESGDPVPIIAKFVKYNIYRKQGEDVGFTDVSGMAPFATIDISATEYQIVDVAYAETYYYAVTIEDKEGNENKNVTTEEYKAMVLNLVDITLSEGKPDANKPLRISVEVRNIGGDYARDIIVEIYVDDVLEETIGPFSIAPDGEPVTKTGDWTTETGEHTIKVVVTYDDGKQKEMSKTISVKKDDSDTPGFELVGAVVGLVGASLVASFMETRRKRH